MSDKQSDPPPTLPVKPAVRDLKRLLDTTWRVSLKNEKRIFTGKFLVVDRRVSRNSTESAPYDLSR
jgi:hypothetical protein